MSLHKTFGWSGWLRAGICGIAALLNALDLGFQGNGNLVLSGLFLGFVLGLAWSSLLLFGVPSLTRNASTPLRVALLLSSGIVVFATLAVICFHVSRQ